MARRQRTLSGSLLDAPIGIDPTSWASDNLLTKPRSTPAPPACQCRPNRGPTDLGGCKPGLRWVSHTKLAAVCLLCQKPLVVGTNKRRDQLRMLGLASLALENLDLEDLREWGVLTDERPGPEALS